MGIVADGERADEGVRLHFLTKEPSRPHAGWRRAGCSARAACKWPVSSIAPRRACPCLRRRQSEIRPSIVSSPALLRGTARRVGTGSTGRQQLTFIRERLARPLAIGAGLRGLAASQAKASAWQAAWEVLA